MEKFDMDSRSSLRATKGSKKCKGYIIIFFIYKKCINYVAWMFVDFNFNLLSHYYLSTSANSFRIPDQFPFHKGVIKSCDTLVIGYGKSKYNLTIAFPHSNYKNDVKSTKKQQKINFKILAKYEYSSQSRIRIIQCVLFIPI